MFLSKTKRQTRFEKFVSTLIIVSMSFSFLLTGIPSKGGVRPAEAAINSFSPTKPDVNQGGPNQQAEDWSLNEQNFGDLPGSTGNFVITVRDNANLKTISFSQVPSVSASSSISGLNTNLGPSGESLIINFLSSQNSSLPNEFINITNVKYNVPPDVALGDVVVTVTGGSAGAFNDVDPGNPGMQISPNATVITGASPQGKIAFNSDRDGNYEIYVMNADGSNQTRLTNNPAADSDPDLSPDGSKITFRSNRSGNLSIYVMNADGSGTTQLTSGNPEGDFDPTWSPDGTKIAFARGVSNGKSEIYVMNADGSGLTNLTNNGMLNNAPTWSPDGNNIAFTQAVGLGSDSEIYVMNSNGNAQTNLTNYPGLLESYASWSPDGIKIAFSRYGGGNFSDIFTMNPDGNGQTNLTNSSSSDDSGSTWSPDGTKIAFLSNISEPANGDIYVMNADGSSVTRITSNPANDSGPDWGPGSVPPPSDTTSPELTGSAPINGGVDIPVNLPDFGIGLNFSEPIIPADSSALGTNIRFKKSDGTYLDEKLLNFSNVSGYDYKVDMTGGNLEYDTTYIVEISGFKDASNNTMAPTTVTFTTESAGPPPNNPPVANAGGPYTINTGDDLMLDGSSSSDPDDGIAAYSWDINNDSSEDATGVSSTVPWTQIQSLPTDTPIPVTLKVTDTQGAFDINSTTLTINSSPPPTNYDFGDAQDPGFPSTLASNGARHIGPPSYYFGNGIDYETDSNQVNADNLDDGLIATSPVTFNATMADSNPHYVNILIDLNQNGNWNDPGELVVQDYNVGGSGTYIPDPGLNLADNMWMRMTLTDIPLNGTYNGSWPSPFGCGETEDYIFSPPPSDSQGPSALISNPLDGQNISSFFDVFAQIDDTVLGGSNISEAILQVDSDPPQPMNANDGAFDSPIEIVTLNLNSTLLSNGPHTITVTGRDAANNWSSPSIVNVNVNNGPPSTPLLDANLTANWISGDMFSSYENISVSINGGSKGFFNLQASDTGGFWLDGQSNGFLIERGDSIDVTYSGGTVSMVVQNLNAAVNADADTVTGNALDKFDNPLEGYTAAVQIVNPENWGMLASLETTVGADGSFTADFSQLPFDLQNGQKVMVDLFGGGTGHSTLLELGEGSPQPSGIQILDMYPQNDAVLGLNNSFNVYGTGEWQRVEYDYSQDGFMWYPIGIDNWTYVEYGEVPYSYSIFEWFTEGLPGGNYQVRATAYDYSENSSNIIRSYYLDTGNLDNFGPAPVNLSATPDTGKVVLNWNASTSPDTNGYIIYRSIPVPTQDAYWLYGPSPDAYGGYFDYWGLNPSEDAYGNYPSQDAFGKYFAYDKWFYPIAKIMIPSEDAQYNYEYGYNTPSSFMFEDTRVVSPDAYHYIVRGVDGIRNIGDPSNEAFASPFPDEIAPQVLEMIPDNNKIGLWAWFEALGTDNAAWTRVLFEYQREGEEFWNPIGQDNWPIFADRWDANEETQEEIYLGKLWSGSAEWYTEYLEEGNYTVRVTAYDYAGNTGSISRNYFIDKTPPAPITDLIATPGEGFIQLNWSVPSGDAISEYMIFRSTQPLPTMDAFGDYPSPDAYGNYPSEDAYFNYFYTSINTNTFKDVDVSPDATYYYRVISIDDVGNMSDLSNEANAQANSDVTPPQVLIINPEGSKVGINTWLAPLGTDNAGWDRVVYEYSADGGQVWSYIGQDDWPWYGFWDNPENMMWRSWIDWYNEGLEEGTYLIRATAYDFWNNSGSLTKEFYLDKTPPDAPTNLTAAPGNGFVDLNWIPSISGDTAWYNIYKSTEPGYGQFGWFVASVDASSIYYRDYDVMPDVPFYYSITATDDVNNESQPSNEASALPEMGSSATVSGQVLSGGQPVPNATVYAYPDWESTGGNYYPWIPEVITNENGEFSIQFPVKNDGVMFWLNAQWYDANTYNWVTTPGKLTPALNADDFIPDFNLSAGPSAPVVLNPQYGATTNTPIVGVNGKASPNAEVTINHSGYDANWTWQENISSTFANPNGDWHLDITPYSEYNYLSVTQTIEGEQSPPAWLYFYSNVIEDAATISGKALSGGVPVVNATVYIQGSWQTNYYYNSTTTDINGNYSFTVPSGAGFEYSLGAYKYVQENGMWQYSTNNPSVIADAPTDYPNNNLLLPIGAPTVTKPDYGILVKSSPVGLVGSAQPGATINVSVYSYDTNWYHTGTQNHEAIVSADAFGNYNAPLDIVSGHHYIYVSQTVGDYTSEQAYTYIQAQLPDENNAIISGTVTQGESLVQDANVFVWQNYYGGNYVGYIPPDITDANGDYSIPVPKGASYSIYAYKGNDYSSTKIVPETGTTVAGQTYDVDMSFKPIPPTIDTPTNGGTVDTSPTTISGTADIGATVKLNVESYDANWNWKSNNYTTIANESGNWSINIPVSNGYNYISASQTSGTEESYLTYSNFYVQLAASAATISGQVKLAGTGVPNANVEIYGSWPSYFSKSVQADGNGDYSAKVEGNTTYWVYAWKVDDVTGNYLYSNWEQVSVTTGNTTKDITMRPPAPKINSPAYGSNVTDSSTTVSGKAAPNLPVTIKVYGYTSSGQYKDDTYTTNADVNGNFSKSGVIVYNGYNTVYAYQTDSGIDSDWTYHYYYGQLSVSSGTLSGLVSQNGSPIEGATVYAYANNNWWNAYSTTTNSNGTYTLKLPAGSQYYVYAYKGDSYSSYYNVPSSGTVADGGSYTQNLGLPPSAPSITSPTDATTYSEVDGKLTANGTSLANAGITITQYSYNIYGYYVPNTYSTTADSSGNWSKEIDVNNGDNYLYVSQTDTLGTTSPQTYVGFYVKDAPQSFTQEGTLSGIVTNAKTGAPVEGATVLAYTYSTNFTAETDVNGNYTIQLPATGGWGTYLTAYSYISEGGKYGNAPAQSFWVTDGSNTNADFKLAFANSDSNGAILSTNWNYREGKIDYRMVFGASPGIDNLDQSSTNLEISVGSDEYYAQDPNLSGWASGIIRTFDSGGTINWIKSTDNDEARSSVAIADTDSDGKLEVALGTTSGSQIQLWSNSGSKKWAKSTGGFVHSSPAIADLVPTKTGSEVIGGSYSGSVYVQGNDGNDIWSYNTGSSIVSSPSVGDIDGDGKREVVVGSTNNKVYVLSNSGSKLYEYTTGGEINSSPARADLNKDGKDEIIIGSNDGNVYALSIPASGTTLTKLWSYKTGGAVYSSPSIADIDKNGNLDVVVGSNDNNIYALTSKGALKWKYTTNGAVYSSAAIADRGNDSVGIYIGSEDGSLYMLEGNGANAGKIIDRFDTGALIRTSPAVADTDGDEKLDIFFSDWRSGGDLFWGLEDNTSSVAAYSKEWPQFGYNAAHRRAKLDLTTDVAPAAPVITSPDPSTTKYSNSNAQTISGTNASGSTVEVFDGITPLGQANVTDTTWTINTNLATEGTHNITAKAKKDTLVSDSSSTLKIVIDTTNPSITVTGVIEGKSYSSGVKANYSASDASPVTPTATLSKDGGAANSYSSGTAITDAGNYQLVITATDSAGNLSTKTINFTVTASDTTPPTVTFVDPTPLNDSVVYNPTQTIKATLSDAGSGINPDTVVIRRTIPSQETIPIEIVSLSLVSSQPITVTQGSNAFEVEAKDNSGNTTIKTVKFYYSANQPSMTITPTTSIDPGDKITLTGASFTPNDIVKITRVKADGSEVYVGSATTNGSGAFTYDYITPANISAGSRDFKAVGSYNASATASVKVKLDFLPESGSSFKQANQTIYVNGGEAASSMTMNYITEPDNGAPAVNMTPVSKESSTTWHYGTLPGSIMPKGSYKVTATAKKSDGSTLASSSAIYHISEQDLSLEFVPQSGSTVTKSTTSTFKVLAGTEVQSVAFSYSTDGGQSYGTPEVNNLAVDSFFDVFFDLSSLTNIDAVKVKAVPNNDPNKAVIANYTLKSPTTLSIYPTDGSIINDNPTLAAKASSDVVKVRFDRFNAATGNWDSIGEDTEKDSAGWFTQNLNTLGDDGQITIKVRAVPDTGAGYDESKSAVASYTLDKDLTLTLVSPNDNSTVDNNPFVWVKAGDGVTSVKAEISTDNGQTYQDATSSTDEGVQLNESNMLKYPNTNQWYLHLYTLDLGSSTDFNLRFTPNNSTNPNDILVLSYTTPAAENLGVTLFPNDGSTIGKDATLTAVGESEVQSVEFFYSYYDGSTWSEPEPLPTTSTGSNTVAKGDDQFFRVEINSDEIVDGQIKVTANSYNTDKSNGSSDTNDYTHDTTAPNKPKTVTVTYAEGQDEGINVHWADPKNQATDVAGYNVYRQKDSAISSIDELTPIAFVQYDGTDSSYFYLDHEAPVIKGTFHYAVTAVDNAGNESEHKQGNKSITMSSPVPENEGESQLILPSEGDDDKELYAVGESPVTDAFELAIEGDEVNNPTVVDLDPINDNSADTYSENEVLNDIEGQENNDMQLGGSIFDITSTTTQDDQVVNQLNSANTGETDAGASMTIAYDDSTSNTPDNYADKLEGYDEANHEYKASNDSDITQYTYSELWRYGSKLKKVTGQTKTGNKIFSKVRRFSAYMVMFVGSPSVEISNIDNDGEYNTSQAPSVSISAGANPIASQYILLKKNGATLSYNTEPTDGPIPVTDEGTYYLEASATDESNETTTIYSNFSIDKTPPTISFASTAKAQGTYVKGTISIPVTASDVASGLEKVELYYGTTLKSTDTVAPYTFSVNTTQYSNGQRTFKIKAYDNVGNTKEITRYYKVDNTKPKTKAPYSKSVKRYSYARLYYRVDDSYSPTAKVVIRIKNSKGTVVKTLSLGYKYTNKSQYYNYKASLAKGTYRFYIYATDRAGNTQYNIAYNKLVIK